MTTLHSINSKGKEVANRHDDHLSGMEAGYMVLKAKIHLAKDFAFVGPAVVGMACVLAIKRLCFFF